MMKWWRRITTDSVLEQAERLLREIAQSDADIEQAAQRLGKKQPPAPAIKLCKRCQWHSGSVTDRCRSPQQPGYEDKAGSDDWSYASTVRQFYCHGKWWEPRA
jgi:hypothetical protein